MAGMKDFMKQAQMMQSRIEQMQANMAAQEVTGSAGGGLVKATMTGKGDVKGISIDPSLLVVDEKDVLEDLIVAAIANAKSSIETQFAQQMQELTGGMLPPGMKLPF